MNKQQYLLSSFSLQMVDAPFAMKVTEVDAFPADLTSAVGHQDTANVLGVQMNRISVHLTSGDICYVAQLMGGRLPEGSITLPEGFTFKYLKVEIL